MKFRYYIRGFGAGLIVATAVLLIAGMIEKNNNYIVSDNKETQSSGSVIAFTTESTDNKEKETQKTTGKSDEETTQVNKETTTAVVARETESQRPTASIVIGDGSGLVQSETFLICGSRWDFMIRLSMYWGWAESVCVRC